MRIKIICLRLLSRSITVHIISDICAHFKEQNYPSLDWSIHKPLCNDYLYVEFIDYVLINAFEQIVDEPKRGGNVLDLVLRRNFDVLHEIIVILNILNYLYALILQL